MNFNRVILVGRLTRDPELRSTPDGVPVCQFSVAVNRQSKDDVADFFDCSAWRQQAEFLANYAQKGRLVLVEGRLQNRSWVGQDGQKRYKTEIQAEHVRLLDRAREGASDAPVSERAVVASTEGAAPQEPAPVAASHEPPPAPDFDDFPDDDSDPFSKP